MALVFLQSSQRHICAIYRLGPSDMSHAPLLMVGGETTRMCGSPGKHGEHVQFNSSVGLHADQLR